ncbi:MAG: Gfo/Idh/MocA family oxidoreductase [Geminicoccaceae bacterium]|jgi:predicted dehydrogenase|nr:Gfo/Idh/MocA family oxidoreductase [Geminicoccaceae bacterium]HRY25409.1 Gfo/Idh/MocA family oxidoreductase [Geminicoccaceae bacterium]
MRYAIIGSGMMGQEHIENIKLLPDSSVVALADPDEGMRRQAAGRCGPEVRTFADYRELLGAGGIDALVIVTPNYTHRAVLMDALATGLPILTEKPLCTTVEDCDAVLAAAEGRAAPVWVAMEYRFMPPVARLIEEVRKGTVGRLRMLSIREHRFPFLKKVGDWNRFARNTGGTMVEKCCHYFDLMRLIVGAEAVRLYASGGQDVNHLDETYGGERPDIVDNGYVVVDFANGVRAMLDLCMFAEVSRDQEEIAAVGDRGKVECGTPSSRLWIGRRDTGELTEEVVPVDETVLAAGQHHGSTYYQHRAFLELVKQGGRPEVSLHDGRMAVMMGAAAERSMRERVPVTF